MLNDDEIYNKLKFNHFRKFPHFFPIYLIYRKLPEIPQIL